MSKLSIVNHNHNRGMRCDTFLLLQRRGDCSGKTQVEYCDSGVGKCVRVIWRLGREHVVDFFICSCTIFPCMFCTPKAIHLSFHLLYTNIYINKHETNPGQRKFFATSRTELFRRKVRVMVLTFNNATTHFPPYIFHTFYIETK